MKISTLRLAFLTLAMAVSAGLSAQFVTEREIKDDDAYVEDQEMNIVVLDNETHEHLENDVIIRGYDARKIKVFEDVTDTVIPIKNYRLYTVSCIREGYMYYNEKFWPDEKKVHFQKVNLKKLEIGLKTDIRDIYFKGNETAVYHKSKPAIDELIEWMNVNETVKIRVIGHANGPNNEWPQRVYNKASKERAEVVVEYMIDNGIDKSRLEFIGAGNTEMIYEDPQTNWENEANRRVEIEVIGL